MLAVLVIVFIAKGLISVRQAETMVIERFGRFHKCLESGINIIIPFLDKPREIVRTSTQTDENGKVIFTREVTDRIDLREALYDFPRQNVITKDNVAIIINGLLYYQITDPVKTVYEIAHVTDALEKLAQTTLRSVIGEMDLDQTLSSRDAINRKLNATLDEVTHKWGVKVNRVEIQDIIPPADIKQAMEKQMRAERDRRASILQAEGAKQSDILESEGSKTAEINRAEGQKQARMLIADAEASSRIKVAKAEAEAIKMVSESINSGKGDPVSYLIAVRYIETLKEMVSGKDNKVVYLPFEATGILGSLGGIKELLTGMNGRDDKTRTEVKR
jgi:regulator of protease activity HflC (stomatin/prohibitin superfamily)